MSMPIGPASSRWGKLEGVPSIHQMRGSTKTYGYPSQKLNEKTNKQAKRLKENLGTGEPREIHAIPLNSQATKPSQPTEVRNTWLKPQAPHAESIQRTGFLDKRRSPQGTRPSQSTEEAPATPLNSEARPSQPTSVKRISGIFSKISETIRTLRH